MVVVAVLALAALVLDPLLRLLRRSRLLRSTAEARHLDVPGAEAVPAAGAPAEGDAPARGGRLAPVVPLRSVIHRRPALHVRRYPSLLVSWSAADELVLVLVPAGQDPQEVLRVARVVLPEEVYGAVEAELPSALLAVGQRGSRPLGA